MSVLRSGRSGAVGCLSQGTFNSFWRHWGHIFIGVVSVVLWDATALYGLILRGIYSEAEGFREIACKFEAKY